MLPVVFSFSHSNMLVVWVVCREGTSHIDPMFLLPSMLEIVYYDGSSVLESATFPERKRKKKHTHTHFEIEFLISFSTLFICVAVLSLQVNRVYCYELNYTRRNAMLRIYKRLQ